MKPAPENPPLILLTGLGMSARETEYTWQKRKATAPLAPLALIDLLDETQKPTRVLALATKGARDKTWPGFQQGVKDLLDLKAECIDIPDGKTTEEVGEIVKKVAGAVPEGSNLVLDVTQGLRHFPFIMYAVALYLKALRGVNITGVYYGMFETDSPKPIIDLQPLLELPRWFYAIRVLKDTGSAHPIGEALGSTNKAGQDMARDLGFISSSYLSGLPLELGYYAQNFLTSRSKAFKKNLRKQFKLPLVEELWEQITNFLQPFQLDESVSGDGWKNKIDLTESELKRQRLLIDGLWEHGDYSAALRLMSEWVASWIIWQRSDQNWLDFQNTRRPAGRDLGALDKLYKDPSLKKQLSSEQIEFAEFYKNLFEARNSFAHQGMRGEDVVGGKKNKSNLEKIKSYWEKIESLPKLDLSLKGSYRNILISPIGNRPGVLYSAVKIASEEMGEPDLCLIISSKESEKFIDEALKEAGYTGAREILILQNPFGGGHPEINRIKQESLDYLVKAEQVVVNITGGTTLMGLAAESLAQLAREFATPARRFGLIDRRKPAEQEKDPYQLGEFFPLDPKEEENENDQ